MFKHAHILSIQILSNFLEDRENPSRVIKLFPCHQCDLSVVTIKSQTGCFLNNSKSHGPVRQETWKEYNILLSNQLTS